MQSKHIVSPMD